MAASDDVLRFVGGCEFRITKSAADTNGEYLEMEWSISVRHPHQGFADPDRPPPLDP